MSDEGGNAEFSQDEIDALMAGMGDQPAETSQPEQQTPSVPEGDLSQDDINALLGGGGPAEAASPEVPQGELSQDDINDLLGGSQGGGSSESNDVTQGDIDAIFAEAAEGGETPEATDGEVSQADIDALLSGGGASTEVSQADIDALVDAAANGDAAPAEDTRVDTLGRPFDDAAAAMQAAIDAEKAAAPQPPPVDVQGVTLPDLSSDETAGGEAHRVTMLNDVNLNVRIELGRARMLVEDVLRLGEGSVVELERLAGDPVDVFVNSRLVARGEVLVLNDNFCVRISEVLAHDPHRIAS